MNFMLYMNKHQTGYNSYGGIMKKDRKEIRNIISEMLDNPNEHGIFRTSTAYTKLEHYIEGVRAEAIGWAHADACVLIDNDLDPRLQEVPEMLQRAQEDLGRFKL